MPTRCFLSGKIHRATVTESRLDYEGSISVDQELLARAGILAFEQVDVYNVTNGDRLSTYAIPGDPGQVCLNGAAARRSQPGDLVIIAAFAWLGPEEIPGHKPRIVLVGPGNQPCPDSPC